MKLEEKQYLIDGANIFYKYKPRKYDNKHLIVVFSGFGGNGEFSYDFENALLECPAHVLWIKDCFDGHCAYYICQGMSFSIENRVIDFIRKFTSDLGVEKSEVTFAGFSKGGSAALYFGLKYNYKNIVSTVPQFFVGSYVKNNWPVVGRHMMGDLSEKNIDLIDRLLPNVLRDDFCLNKNVYLLTSPADDQYKTQIVPHLSHFLKYENFNLFLAKSYLVRAHNQVTSYHVPLLLSIFYSLSQGAVPTYGCVELTADQKLPPDNPIAEPVALLKKAKFENDRFFLEGVSLLKGIPCGDYGDISVKLCFDIDGVEIFSLALAKGNMPNLTKEYYSGEFVPYDKAWFCTYQYKGLLISGLPEGVFDLGLDITCRGVNKKTPLKSDGTFEVSGFCNGYKCEMYSVNNSMVFRKVL